MSEQVRKVSHSGLEAGPATAGMSRGTAFASENVWVGEVRTAPGVFSGWHHHGEHTTYVRVISGSVRVDFGPGGKEIMEAHEGDFATVPPHVIHREGNSGAHEHVLAVVRTGSGPSVVNVEGPEAPA